MIDMGIWAGVQSLLEGYVKIQADDFVVLLYTSDSYESAAWMSAALELRGILARRVWMAPLHDDGFQERLSSALPSPSEWEGRLVVLSFERDTMSHGRALDAALRKFGHRRCAVFRAISSCSNLFSDAAHPGYARVTWRSSVCRIPQATAASAAPPAEFDKLSYAKSP